MSKVYISIGSNMGDKQGHLAKAVQLLNMHDAITVIKESAYYETLPVGYTDQENFINQVIELDTILSPDELLDYCQLIEFQLKRKREIKWGPRTIDLDILLYDNQKVHNERLIIPHPRMIDRAFVMVPLYEIAPELTIFNQNINQIIDNLQKTISENIIKKL